MNALIKIELYTLNTITVSFRELSFRESFYTDVLCSLNENSDKVVRTCVRLACTRIQKVPQIVLTRIDV